jgi:hypothetical protein
MITRGGNQGMGHRTMNEEEAEAILSGDAVAHPELAAVLSAFQTAATAPLPEQTAIDQIRMVSKAARLVNTGVRAPVSYRSRTKRRWATALTTDAAWKIVVASAALAAASGAAAAGALPDPLQLAVSAAASRLGIEIPNGVDRPNLDESVPGEISQPGRPDQDHSDKLGIDSTDQPHGAEDIPVVQFNEPDTDQTQTGLLDQSDEEFEQTEESEESKEGPAEQSDDNETGQADDG